jgi:hypothetical protein
MNKRHFFLFLGIIIGLGISTHLVQSAPDPVADSVTGKTWLEDRDRLRAQWLNGNFQALFNWANGGITITNLATNGITLSNIATGSGVTVARMDLSTIRKEIQIASSGQTIFTLANSYTPAQNRMEVFIDGCRQTSNDFTETASQTVTFDTPLLAGLQVEFIMH